MTTETERPRIAWPFAAAAADVIVLHALYGAWANMQAGQGRGAHGQRRYQ